MKVDLIFLSYNRLHYTMNSIPALLADPSEEFSLTIWDNASTDGSREYLEAINDSRIVKKVFSPKNIGSYAVYNQAIRESSADLLGLVADDFLVTPGWTRILSEAHAEIPEFGRLSCWHFAEDTFNYQRAKHKIQTFGRHKVLRHPWTNGCGLTKTRMLHEFGLMQANEGESAYWRRVALAGYVVGYYCPPILVEHMDYPWASHFPFTNSFDEWVRQSSMPKTLGFKNMEDAKIWHQHVLDNILDGPWDAKNYVGWRGRLQREKDRLRRMLTGSRY